MHSRIFQISTLPVTRDNYIDENTFIDGDYSFYDYCANIDDDERKNDIRDLLDALPKGMFELTSENTLFYKGGAEGWKEEFVANLRRAAEALTVGNMLEWRTTYALEQALKNPLDTDYRFYLDEENLRAFAEPSFAFMEFVCFLEPGTTLYIGGVVDYHY